MSFFVYAQGIKTVHAGGGGQKWQNSVHVVVECPLTWKHQMRLRNRLALTIQSLFVNLTFTGSYKDIFIPITISIILFF